MIRFRNKYIYLREIIKRIMMYNERMLPAGIQDFEKLRTSGCLYVDKTRYVYQLVRTNWPYFLGRPRRFGKSLLLSTLKAYFEGKKELFEGLAIAELEKDWTAYPVIYIDFNIGGCDSLPALEEVAVSILEDHEHKWGITDSSEHPSVRFKRLIQAAYEKSGKKVVVLIDEYDKPLVHTMDNPDLNDAVCSFFKGFYGVLKSMDYALRFVFLTGVTKFSKVSIFSDLNQLTDISLDKQYAGVCGISETELTRYFAPEIQSLADELEKTYDETLVKLKKHYNGYHFSGKTEEVYNPFSLLRTFVHGIIRNYWFETGTPTLLVRMLRKVDFDIKSLDNDVPIAFDAIMDYRVENTDPVPLLYQTGYLTIKSYNELLNVYTLGFPNEEVKYGFWNELLYVFMPKTNVMTEFYVGHFIRDLWAGNIESFMTRLKAFFAGIPCELDNKTEKHYQTVFYLLFKLMGQFIDAEPSSAIGRADAVVKTVDAVYVFEFKLTGNGTAETALKQIDDKGYLIPYTAGDRKLVKIGAEFSTEERGLKRWIIIQEE